MGRTRRNRSLICKLFDTVGIHFVEGGNIQPQGVQKILFFFGSVRAVSFKRQNANSDPFDSASV